MSRRYIPCRYTYNKNSSCPKVKKNTDKITVQNNYNPGSRAELLSNMSKLCVQLSSKFIQEESSSAHQTKIIESYLEKVKN